MYEAFHFYRGKNITYFITFHDELCPTSQKLMIFL